MNPPSSSSLQSLFLLALPGGGQRVARRNAWAGMSELAGRGRHRREAEVALERSWQRTSRRAGAGS